MTEPKLVEPGVHETTAAALNESLASAADTLRVALAGFMRVHLRASHFLEEVSDLGKALGPHAAQLELTELDICGFAVDVTDQLEQRFGVANMKEESAPSTPEEVEQVIKGN